MHKGWGKPLPGCPNGGGADATSGTTQIFFVYITQGELGSKFAKYGVVLLIVLMHRPIVVKEEFHIVTRMFKQ
jgi:hypothetical protein